MPPVWRAAADGVQLALLPLLGNCARDSRPARRANSPSSSKFYNTFSLFLTRLGRRPRDERLSFTAQKPEPARARPNLAAQSGNWLVARDDGDLASAPPLPPRSIDLADRSRLGEKICTARVTSGPQWNRRVPLESWAADRINHATLCDRRLPLGDFSSSFVAPKSRLSSRTTFRRLSSASSASLSRSSGAAAVGPC